MDTRQRSEIVFKEFIDLILSLTNNDKDVQRRLERCYNRTNPHFRWSRGFINLVTLCRDRIQANPEKKLVHVKEFTDELSNYKAKPLKHLIENGSCVSDSDDEEPPPKRLCAEPTKNTSPKIVAAGEAAKNCIPTAPRKVLSEVPKQSFTKNHVKSVIVSPPVAAGLAKTVVDGMMITNRDAASRDLQKRNDESRPITSNSTESEGKSKHHFYNSVSLPILCGPNSNINPTGLKHKQRIRMTDDVICLDDDDEENCSLVETDSPEQVKANATEKMTLPQVPRNRTTSPNNELVTLSERNCHKKTSNDSISTVGNDADVADDKGKTPATAEDKRTSRMEGNTGCIKEVEVICLDDEDDELVDGKKPNRDGSVTGERRVIVKPRDDFGIIDITDTDEQQSTPMTSPPKEIEDTEKVNWKRKTTSDWNGSSVYVDVADDSMDSDDVETGSNSKEIAKPALENSNLDSSDVELQDSVDEANEPCSPDGAGDTGQNDVIHDEKIKRLERILQKLDVKIQRLQQTELTIEDLNSSESSYIEEARLKRRFFGVWKKLCRLVHCPSVTGRPVEKNISVEVSDYPMIGEAVHEFINRNRQFPDYEDILEVVTNSSSSNNLALTDSILRSLSQNIFENVGNRIQEMRRMDLADHLKCYLPDSVRAYDDPAVYDQDLAKTLEENRKSGKEKLEEVFKTFAEKQDAEGDHTDDEDEDSEDEEEDDDDEDDDEVASASGSEAMDDIDEGDGLEATSDAGAASATVSELDVVRNRNEVTIGEGSCNEDGIDESELTETTSTADVSRSSPDNRGTTETKETTISEKNDEDVVPDDEENNKDSESSRPVEDGTVNSSCNLKIRTDLLESIRRMSNSMRYSFGKLQKPVGEDGVDDEELLLSEGQSQMDEDASDRKSTLSRETHLSVNCSSEDLTESETPITISQSRTDEEVISINDSQIEIRNSSSGEEELSNGMQSGTDENCTKLRPSDLDVETVGSLATETHLKCVADLSMNTTASSCSNLSDVIAQVDDVGDVADATNSPLMSVEKVLGSGGDLCLSPCRGPASDCVQSVDLPVDLPVPDKACSPYELNLYLESSLEMSPGVHKDDCHSLPGCKNLGLDDLESKEHVDTAAESGSAMKQRNEDPDTAAADDECMQKQMGSS